jgi:predicted MFS family arabinose efflux permease
VLLAVSLPLDMSAEAPSAPPNVAGTRLPRRFWLFAGFAVVYGICETTNGNWAQLDMTTDVGATATIASITLTAFWAMVTIGRVVFASLERVIRPQWTYRVLPLGLAGAFLLIAAIPRGASDLGVVLFGLAGLCCSALLPLTISFGQSAFPAIATTISGGVIAAYQLGYGIAAFGIGPLHSAGIPLHSVFAAAAGLALVLAVLAIPVTRPTPSR